MIGLEPTLEIHIDRLVHVFREVRRVLRADGILWLNYGDSYASSPPGNKDKGLAKWATSNLHGAKISAKYAETLDNSQGQKADTVKGSGLKPKNLMEMPSRVVMALQADGWHYHSRIPWIKPNPMPESARGRPSNAVEYFFLLSKSGKKRFWTHPVLPGTRSKPEPDRYFRHKTTREVTRKEPENWRKNKEWSRLNYWQGHDYFYDDVAVRTPLIEPEAKWKTPDGWDTSTGEGGHGSVHKTGREKGQYSQPYTGQATKDYEGAGVQNASEVKRRIVESKRRQRTPKDVDGRSERMGRHVGWRKDKQRGHGRRHEGFNERWDQMNREEQQANGASMRNYIICATHPFKGAHFATFPTKLIRPFILAGSSEHGCCSECGAPWARQEETEYVQRPDMTYVRTHGDNDGEIDPESGWHGVPDLRRVSTTKGWAPTCDCDADVVPCVVLDPFGGSGTVGLVADQLGRDSILIEINADYCAMARERIEADAPLLAEVV